MGIGCGFGIICWRSIFRSWTGIISELLQRTWCLDPSVIAGLEYKEFVQRVWTGRRGVGKERRLQAIWKLAVESVGCEAGPVLRLRRR
jgi:hypothetical protein